MPFKSGGVVLSASDGSYVAATGIDGSVTVATVAGDPLPTQPPRPPTASATPTVAVTPTPVDTITVPAVEIGRVSGAAGDVVQITATLRLANNEEVVATQNDLCVPPGVRIAPKPNGKPDCTVNPDIIKTWTKFSFQPAPLASSAVCTGLRAVVIPAPDDADIPISDGAVLYTCKLDIAADATGSLVLHVTHVVMSDSLGQSVPGAAGIDGVIDIVP